MKQLSKEHRTRVASQFGSEREEELIVSERPMLVQCMQFIRVTRMLSKPKFKCVRRGSLDDVGTPDIFEAEADDKNREIPKSQKTLLDTSLAEFANEFRMLAMIETKHVCC